MTIADGFDPTRNIWEFQGEVGTALGSGDVDPDIDVPYGDVDVDIDAEPIALVQLPRPAFGRNLRLQVSKPERLEDISLEIRGPTGRLVASIPGPIAMETGIPLGAASNILLRTPAPMAYRAIYQLAL